MIYILEGNEGGGKSTLATYLSKTLGVEIRHRSKPKSKKEKDQMMFDYLNDIAKAEHTNVIWDRSFYSEVVYGNVMRDSSVISEDQMYTLEKFMQKNGGAIVYYCVLPISEQWELAQARGEDYITNFEDFKKIHLAYDDMFINKKHLIPIVEYHSKNNENLLSL